MAIKTESGVERFQAVLAASGKPYKGSTETNPNPGIISEYPHNMGGDKGIERFKQIQQKISDSRQPVKVTDKTGDSTAVHVATTKISGIENFQKVQETSKLPAQDQQSPVRNEQPTSSIDNSYPYNPQQQKAQEPIVTSSDGTQSSSTVSTDHDPANRTHQPYSNSYQPHSTGTTQDNTANLKIADQQGYERVNYREMLEALSKYNDKEFGKSASYAGVTRLGGNAEYQPWW